MDLGWIPLNTEPAHYLAFALWICETYDDKTGYTAARGSTGITDVEKTQGEEAQKSVAPPPTAQTVWTSGAPDGAICTLWQYN